MEFKASLDLTAKIITGFITALFLFIGVNSVQQFSATGNGPAQVWGAAAALVLVVGIYLSAFLLAPLGYTVTTGNIIVRRRVRNVVIPVSTVRSVTKPETATMVRTIRTFGNGGLFGYYGKFYNQQLGRMTWYATRRSNYVLLDTGERRILLTPDDLALADVIEGKLKSS